MTGPPPAPSPAREAAERLAAAIERVLDVVGGVLLAVLVAVTGAGVVLRYAAGRSILGLEELSIWLFTALVFLGLPRLAGAGALMRLGLVADRLPPRGARVAEIVADGVVAHAALVLLSGGLGVVERLGGTSTALGLPEWLRFAAVPVGAGLALLVPLLRAASARRLGPALAATLLGAALFTASHAGVVARLETPSLAVAGLAFAFLLAGAPLPAALLSGLSLAIPLGALLPEPAIVQTTAAGFGKILLLAVPFFLLASVLMHEGGLAGRLVRLARALVGHRRGGLGQTTLVTNLLFSGVSGSSIADAAFGAKVLAPALTAAGTSRERAAALVAATAVLPNIVPPSIALLILASAADLSVGALFTGGLVAGLVLAAALAVAINAGGRAERPAPRADGAERRAALAGALPVFGLAALILFGIRLGVVTPTEAAAVAALYALLFNLRRDAVASFVGAARDTAAVGLLIGTAAPFVFLLAVDGVPAAVSSLLAGLGPLGVLVAANLVLLAAGAVLDIGAAILLLAPLLVPAAIAAGIDPVAFGVILVANLMVGGLTPPVGVLVYVAAGLTGTRPAAVFRAALPFVAALLLAVAAMTAALLLATYAR